ncbi:hypothetical protein BC629DRAFT_1434083 [Irpex lacteus]|nr:hypothetical protein BC629DRAFT_1434083 [Irpex lacteus]
MRSLTLRLPCLIGFLLSGIVNAAPSDHSVLSFGNAALLGKRQHCSPGCTDCSFCFPDYQDCLRGGVAMEQCQEEFEEFSLDIVGFMIDARETFTLSKAELMTTE